VLGVVGYSVDHALGAVGFVAAVAEVFVLFAFLPVHFTQSKMRRPVLGWHTLVLPHDVVIRVLMVELIMLRAKVSVIVDAETLSQFLTRLQAALLSSRRQMRFLLKREPSLHHMEELHFAGVEYFVDVLVLPTMPRLILMIDRVVPFRRMIQTM